MIWIGCAFLVLWCITLAWFVWIVGRTASRIAETAQAVPAAEPVSPEMARHIAGAPQTVRVHRKDHRGVYVPSEHLIFGSEAHLKARRLRGVRIECPGGEWEGEE